MASAAGPIKRSSSRGAKSKPAKSKAATLKPVRRGRVAGRWEVAVDTGGTFTDGHARDPQGGQHRCKVLSSGQWRTRLLELADGGRRLRVEGAAALPQAHWLGFQVQALEAASASAPQRRASKVLPASAAPAGRASLRLVQGHKPGSSWLELDQAVDWAVGSLLELFTGEEAAVLAARVLTGTAALLPLPPMRLRVATTRATNALLEGKVGAVALWVTQGFGDLVWIGDQRRRDLFALWQEPRVCLQREVVEVAQRVAVDGRVLAAPRKAEVMRAARRCLARGVDTAALCLVHAARYPQHERLLARWLLQAGFKAVVCSHESAAFAHYLRRLYSTLADACLRQPVQQFLHSVAVASREVEVMSSSGGLRPAAEITPKEMVLSGPAGGVIGAWNAARQMGFARVITLDMGGTSTDVACIDQRPGYRFVQQVGDWQLLVPSLAIETVAAGGGSICSWGPDGLAVGPQSAGADPGPACYGKGGPLTITDVNLLLGRLEVKRAPLPLNVAAAKEALAALHRQSDGRLSPRALCEALLALAIETMAAAIRRVATAQGVQPADFALLAFGGAGPQHACAVAQALGMRTVLVPRQAGLLSAVGVQQALAERFEQQDVALPLKDWLASAAARQLPKAERGMRLLAIAELRLRGQEQALQVEFEKAKQLPRLFVQAHQRLFGYPPPRGREVELVSLRLAHQGQPLPMGRAPRGAGRLLLRRELLQDAFSTLVCPKGWRLQSVGRKGELGLVLRAPLRRATRGQRLPGLRREHVTAKLQGIVAEMGALLQRTAISTNIRERLDFSCALLDAQGRLLTSAPHIPVHLGALGVCVRAVAAALPLRRGDTVITNHPAHGGSHLPDITLITPVFDRHGLLGYVANRAHHAEIGGMTPGSMPAQATCLQQEGVVIAPGYLVRRGRSCFAHWQRHFSSAAHPSRQVADNLADLHAQLAANVQGARRLLELPAADLRRAMQEMLGHSAQLMRQRLRQCRPCGRAVEKLDDGHRIVVRLEPTSFGLRLDFTGTSAVHPRNLNATQAIVRSAVLYTMRLLLGQEVTLNEGLMEAVELRLPPCLLAPAFVGDAALDPAVVGGNVEISQRLVDALLRALGLAACSQGTMNNFLFGDERFGYYETIAGGAGAVPGRAGASGLHTHMTNTAITDVEVLERRYPVRLLAFERRVGSGGAGRFAGGDGLRREFEFLAPLTISLLAEHRRVAPYGMSGGQPGQCGAQWLWRRRRWQALPGALSLQVHAGERLRLETPGGGAWGRPQSSQDKSLAR